MLIKLTETLHKDLLFGKAVYHKVFMKLLDINYVAYVSTVIEKHLAADTNATMKKVNKLIATYKSKIEFYVFIHGSHGSLS